MKLIIQRVDQAAVQVEGKCVGEIGRGFLILVGIGEHDTKELADKMLDKALKLRIFEDENGKTNLSLAQINGELLIVSQFTLYANCKKGHRPSFTEAGNPELANELYKYMLEQAKAYSHKVESGVFGAHMSVSLTNNGPFTIILDSKELFGV